jgi:hypothetical protein
VFSLPSLSPLSLEENEKETMLRKENTPKQALM